MVYIFDEGGDVGGYMGLVDGFSGTRLLEKFFRKI